MERVCIVHGTVFGHKKSFIPKTLNLTAKPFVRSTQTTPTSVSIDGLRKKKEPVELTNNNYLTSPPTSDKHITFNSTPTNITTDETSRAKELLTQRLAFMRIQPASPPVRTNSPLVTPASSPSLTLNKSDVSLLLCVAELRNNIARKARVCVGCLN